MAFGLGEFYSLSCALAWAIAVVLFKKSGESLPPVALNLFKNAVGLVLMLFTVLLAGGGLPELPPAALGWTLLSGLLGIAIGDTLYLRALNVIGASRMGVAQTAYSPFVIALSVVFLGERLAAWQWVGAALVVAGILLVSYTQDAVHAHGQALRRGAALAALSVFAMAAGVVMAKPILEHYDFLWVVTLRIAAGLVGLLPVIAWQRSAPAIRQAFREVRHWPHVIAGSVMGTYISMMLWLAGYKYTAASIAALLNEMAAVFIIALAAVFLRERLQPVQLAGAAVALGGVVLVIWP